tara:strand:- start:199 stop:846 length:648 start_codon:yes stop_codon:yes gene_type:complete
MESNTLGQEKPKLIVLTGPQGSGNHMWSKLFAMHPVVTGWIMQNYWEGHHEEPFAEYWQNPDTLKDFEVPENKKYFVTSISCPYFKDGKPQIPKYHRFITQAEKIFDIKICVLGRDPDILKLQQNRVRFEQTTQKALEALEKIWQYKPYMLSMENFYLYRGKYLKRIEEDLDFPMAWNHKVRIDEIADKSSNKKYITKPGEQALDKVVRKVSEDS